MEVISILYGICQTDNTEIFVSLIEAEMSKTTKHV